MGARIKLGDTVRTRGGYEGRVVRIVGGAYAPHIWLERRTGSTVEREMVFLGEVEAVTTTEPEGDSR